MSEIMEKSILISEFLSLLFLIGETEECHSVPPTEKMGQNEHLLFSFSSLNSGGT
jgi:hypothetical protein